MHLQNIASVTSTKKVCAYQKISRANFMEMHKSYNTLMHIK